jgi:hypothetical protein
VGASLAKKRKKALLLLDINDPNRMLEASYHLISLEPLVGVLEITTDQGFIPFGINRSCAEQLASVVDMFLAEKPD